MPNTVTIHKESTKKDVKRQLEIVVEALNTQQIVYGEKFNQLTQMMR